MDNLEQIIEYISNEADLVSSSATPLYRRIMRALTRAIRQGVIDNGEALPSERDLATALGVSRVTVRNALALLVKDGLLVQRPGAGTYVSFRFEQPLSKLTGFTEDMLSRGKKPTVKWLDRSSGIASPEEALALRLSPGAHVSRLYRIRFADGVPLCLERAVLPRKILPNPGTLEFSLYVELEKRGLRPVRALQKLRAQLVEGESAQLLQVRSGSACLYIERCSFAEDGREIEFVRSIYRGDSYDFIAELHL